MVSKFLQKLYTVTDTAERPLYPLTNEKMSTNENGSWQSGVVSFCEWFYMSNKR